MFRWLPWLFLLPCICTFPRFQPLHARRSTLVLFLTKKALLAVSTPQDSLDARSIVRHFVRPVTQVGIAGLPPRLQEILPEMDLGNQAHRKRFEDAIRGFQHGAGIDAAAMTRMYEAQTLWDEYMAESTSR